MDKRRLYIAAYDIRNPRRLLKALRAVKRYASGRQQSVFECFLTPTERGDLLESLGEVLDLDQDRFMLLPLMGTAGVRTLGKAVAPEDPSFFYVG